jgi:hypothetical protein
VTAPQRTPGTSVNVTRPIFQVLREHAQQCMCHVWSMPGSICSQDAMDVRTEDYDEQPDGKCL